MDFETSSINLSLRNAQTGRPLTANVYNVTFDDGSMRTVSVGQLVMALCLDRATRMEADVIAIMERMAGTTASLEAISDIEDRLLALDKGQTISSITGSWTFYVEDEDGTLVQQTSTSALQVLMRMGITANATMTTDAIIDNIEAKLDELNTMSQEQMILLQSQTNKRDQAYEMASNVSKSLYTVMTAVVNNC